MRRPLISCCALILAALAQAAVPSFEVATIKPEDPSALPNLPRGNLPDEIRFRDRADQIDYRGVTLHMLLRRAYSLTPSQISGPNWLDDERYDVVAKFPAGATANDVPVMLQQLLIERFHIVLHREQKTLKIYEVTVAKGGSKLKPAQPESAGLDTRTREDRMAEVKKALDAQVQRMKSKIEAGEWAGNSRSSTGTLTEFLKQMSSSFDRPLKNKTDLAERYAFQIEWSQDPSRGGPSIFAAFEEQLGLKVQPANEEMEYLVIDSASRTPDAN
jgi:uncharacterized protein (TIGR03435 family)